MTNDTEITSALSAEEWAARRTERLWTRQDGVVAVTSPNPPGVFSSEPRHIAISIDLAGRHQAIALLNDSLPDTDPRKITRADVEALTDLPIGDDLGGNDYAAALAVIHTVAAKLAALLPPEH
jgi:hypothetical protein